MKAAQADMSDNGHARKAPGPVALFIPSLNGGGAERVMVSLANGFARKGLDVHLVLVRNEGVYRSAVDAAVRVVDLNGSRTLSSVVALARYLKRHRPRALLSAMNYVNVVAIWARILARSNCRLVISEHANLSQALADTAGAVTKILPWMMKRSYPRADAIITVSDGVAADLSTRLGLARSRIVTRHNPIETIEALNKSAETLAHPWFAAGEPPVILGAGRLSKEKDFATLIKAFDHLRASKNARLVVLGEGAERPALEALRDASDHRGDILLAGFQANPYNWMRAASVFVLSSRWEGFGNVLVEAMACGTPVVSTRCPSGPEEILAQGKWGRLSPVGDARALAAAIDATLSDSTQPDVQNRSQDFSVARAVDAYLTVLDPDFPVDMPTAPRAGVAIP
ncbi:MAG TPA: glycosyltransferase [Burkholderiaceae bacterium]|nr:glycosyltransferase [Burkholderiaceae bacterium]